MKSRNGRNYVISHDFLYLEKTKNKRCTISVNIAPIRMKQLPFDSSNPPHSSSLDFFQEFLLKKSARSTAAAAQPANKLKNPTFQKYSSLCSPHPYPHKIFRNSLNSVVFVKIFFSSLLFEKIFSVFLFFFFAY